MYIDERQARELLCDVAIRVMNDASEEAENHFHEAMGMFIMSLRLGLITEAECSILMDYTERRIMNDDIVECFIEGLYRTLPGQPEY